MGKSGTNGHISQRFTTTSMLLESVATKWLDVIDMANVATRDLNSQVCVCIQAEKKYKPN